MLKAFSLLWLLVFLPICFLIFSYGYSPVWLITNYVQSSVVEDQESGVFYLLEQELSSVPEAQWPSAIQDHAEHFGYDLSLQPLSEAITAPDKQEALSKGDFVLIEGMPNVLLRRIAGTDWVISKALDISEEEKYIRSVQGGAYLLLRQFEKTPKTEWPGLVAEFNTRFIHHFEFVDRHTLPLTREQLDDLNNQQIIWQKSDQAQFEFYRLLPDHETVLKAVTPAYTGVQLGMYIALFVTFITTVSIFMAAWAYPLWRDLKRLSHTAKAFGNGALAERAPHSRASVVSDLSHSFNAMADNIQTLITSQRELTNSIAHDLRTPLYRLKFALEMLDDKDLAQTDKAHYQSCVQISIEDLDQLIDQTLILSRYSRITDLNQFSETLLTEHIEREVSQFRIQYPNITTHIVVSEPLKKTPVFVDRSAFSRVISNLLSNAGKFAETQVQIQFTETDDHYLLTVSDDGPGIAKQHWSTLFKPFTQLGNEHRGNEHGHGLGLAIVEQIAQWHQGEASVSVSELGGARFCVKWPKLRDDKTSEKR